MLELAYGIAWYIVFILSAIIHEAAHAWAAKWGGDLTAYSGGQASLNPLPHFKREPFGMIILPLISVFLIGWPFGYASTPYSAEWAYNNPRKAAWMGLAGPAANLLVVIICFAFIKVGIQTGIFMQPDSVSFRHIVDPGLEGSWTGLSIFISMFFTMNLILLVLNLMPFPPLDGSAIITFFLHDEAARKYQVITKNPLFGLVGLFLAWIAFSPLFELIFVGSINVVYWGSGYS
jgi:Zn-dependent protease